MERAALETLARTNGEESTYYVHVEIPTGCWHRQVAMALASLRRRGYVVSDRRRIAGEPNPFVFWRLTPAGREAVRS